MLDPKLLRSDLAGVGRSAGAARLLVLDTEGFAALEEQRKSVQIEADRLRAERNASAKAVGIAKSKGENAAGLLKSSEALGEQLQGVEPSGLEALQAQLPHLQMGLPNILHASVPDGTRRERQRRGAPLGRAETFRSSRKIMSRLASLWAWISRRRGEYPGRASW